MAIFATPVRPPQPRPIHKQKAQLLPVESVEMVDFYIMCREYHGEHTPSPPKARPPVPHVSVHHTSAPPPPPPPTFGIRLEGQRPDETYEQAEARMEKEAKIVTRLFTTGLIIVGITVIGSIIFTAFK